MFFLTEDYYSTSIRVPRPLLTGTDAKVHSYVGTAWKSGYRYVAEFCNEAERIDHRFRGMETLADSALRRRLLELRAEFRRRKRGYEALLPEALAAIREAAGRKIGLKPYIVQLAGAQALYNGFVAEMAVGEGKTLTAAVAAVIRGWSGYPCHIVTVNDYLAGRDAEWMKPLYDFCGVSVGRVTGAMDADARRKGHGSDVTYTTSKELVADFLRDRLWLGRMQNSERRQISWLLGRRGELARGTVMRGIHSAIVDEVDSILIDEAVTPLIISREADNEAFVEACLVAAEIAYGLTSEEDYVVDARYKDIELTPAARSKISEELGRRRSAYRGLGGYVELVHQALTAREFFHRDEQYVVQDGRVVIVDEFTGRQMPQRTWRAGLHQFIEVKEGLAVSSPTETLARLSFQRFFRFFRNLSGMTGTAREAQQELWDIYELPVLAIPQNRPSRRRVSRPRLFADQETKWSAIVDEIRRVHALGRPLLVGTRSVRASERLAGMLDRAGYSYQLLNAVRNKEEALIVSLAGEPRMITIATNMAGRGTDIRLGKGVAELGGLHVVATECHEAARIDRQLFGRCARQGAAGSAAMFVSMEDEVLRRFLPEWYRRIAARGVAGGGTRPGRPIVGLVGGARLGAAAVSLAQQRAQRMAFKQRRSVLKTDTWLEDSLSFAYREMP